MIVPGWVKDVFWLILEILRAGSICVFVLLALAGLHVVALWTNHQSVYGKHDEHKAGRVRFFGGMLFIVSVIAVWGLWTYDALMAGLAIAFIFLEFVVMFFVAIHDSQRK